MSSSRVRKALHLKKSNLVEAACEDVDDVSVVGDPFRKIVVELF